MMVMRRREGEKILVGDSIVIHITEIGRNRVKIGIQAPREIAITAEEIRRVEQENVAASEVCSPELIQHVTQVLIGAAESPAAVGSCSEQTCRAAVVQPGNLAALPASLVRFRPD